MNLFELAERHPTAPAERVPAWTLGCFHRRSITFFDGATDTTTRVIWLQSQGLTADLRIYAGRPSLSDADALARCSPDDLGRLAEVEGGIASTRWESGAMRWENWTAFQTHAKWPEPGVLRRVGDALIEFAPSGAYVEDWRLQHSFDGPLIGLRLLEERDLDTGKVRHAGGGLVVCGRHAALVRGRPAAIHAPATVSALAQSLAGDAEGLALVFACEASYALAAEPGSAFTVAASTRPWREGQSLMALDGFEYDRASGLVRQRTEGEATAVEREFRVDTLQAHFEVQPFTEVTSGARQWLSDEAETLLRSAQRFAT